MLGHGWPMLPGRGKMEEKGENQSLVGFPQLFPAPLLETEVIFPTFRCLLLHCGTSHLHVSSAKEKVPAAASCLLWRGALSGSHQCPAD